MATSDVVEVAVIRLTDDRVDRAYLLIPRQPEHPVDQGVGDSRDVERVGQQDWCLDLAQLIDLRRAHQLAKAIANDDRPRHLLAKKIAGMRQDRRHSRPDRVATDDRRLPDLHPGNVGDRIQSPCAKHTNPQADLSRPRPLLSPGLRFHCLLCQHCHHHYCRNRQHQQG